MKRQIVLLQILLIIIVNDKAFAQVTFQKTYSVTGFDQGVSAKQTSDSGYIILGYTGVSWKDSTDIMLVKTDVNGDTLWTRTLGDTLIDFGYDVIQTISGDYLIAGTTNSFGAGGYDVYLNRLDANGNILWTKTYGDSTNNSASSVIEINTGNYMLIGTTNSSGANGDLYLIKVNNNGDTLWTKTLTGVFGASGKMTNDKGFIIVGNKYSVAGRYDVCLIKTDSLGTVLWTKFYGATMDDFGNDVEQTIDGGYIITGSTNSFGVGNSDASLIKTNSTGDTLWTRTFGGQQYDFASKVHQTSDGGYIVSGKSGNFSDYYLIKTDSYGDTLWTRSGGTNFEGRAAVQLCNDGGFTITYSGAAYDNLHLIKTDFLGKSGCNDRSAPFIINHAAFQITNFSTTLRSTNTIISTPPTVLKSGSNINTLCFTNGINEIFSNHSNQIYPNPFSNELTIKETKPQGQIILFDITGKQILKQKTFDVETKINTEKLSAGFYLLNYIEGNKSLNFKLVKE